MSNPVAYIRRSVARRGDPGDVSREFQTEKVRALANGDGTRLEVLDGDWGRSAAGEKTDKRLAFLGLLASVERGEVSTLYAYSTDRLARSVRWSAQLLDACEAAGTTIVTSEGRFAPGDDLARQMFHFQAMQNEGALRAMTQKAKASVESRERRGDKIGQRRYGEVRTLRDGRTVGEDENVDLVLATFREAGSYFAAARLLNDRSVPARSGGAWYPRTVQRIVNANDAGTVPLGQRRGVRAIGSRLFSNLLVCHCGALMGQTTSHWANKYRCPRGVADPSHPRPYVVSEARIIGAIQDEAAHLRIPYDEVALGDQDDRKRQALQAEKARLTLDWVRSGLGEDTVQSELARIDKELAALEVAQRVRSIPSSIDWSKPEPVVNAALRLLWERVELGPDLMPKDFEWRVPEWRAD